MYESLPARQFPWVRLVFAAVSMCAMGASLAVTLWLLRVVLDPPRPATADLVSRTAIDRGDADALARATLAAAMRGQRGPVGAEEDTDVPSTAAVATLLAEPARPLPPPRLDPPASPYPIWPAKLAELPPPAAAPAMVPAGPGTVPAAPGAAGPSSRPLAMMPREARPPRPPAQIPRLPGAEPGQTLAAAVPVPRNRPRAIPAGPTPANAVAPVVPLPRPRPSP